MITHQRASRQ